MKNPKVARFEFIEPSINSYKYWEARETEDGFEIAYGRLGAVPNFGGVLSYSELQKKIREKLRKGYIQVSGPLL